MPQKKFSKSQITKKRGKFGSEANERACFDCMKRQDRICPGNIVAMADGGNKRVYCFVCLTLRYHFCNKCHWCSGCAKSRVAKTYRKRSVSVLGCCDGMIEVVNQCSKHDWYKVPPEKEYVPSDAWYDMNIWDPDADGQWSP